RESGVPTDSVTGLNFRTIGPSERFVISLDSSHHSSINVAEAGIDSFVRSVAPPPVMTKAVITTNVASIPFLPAPKTSTKVISPVHASMFHDSDSMRKVRPDAAGSSHITIKELSMGSRDINSKTLYEVFVSQWNISNDTLLYDHDVSREFIDHLAPLVLFSQIREMDYHHLFMEFNVRTARQACLNAKVKMGTEYCLSERKRFESKCESQADLLKAKDVEIEKLKAQLLLKEAKVAEAAHLYIQVSAAEATEKIHAEEIDVLKQRNVTLENEKDSLDGKVVELQSSIFVKDLELKDLNVAVSTLRSQKDGLVDQVHALETTCSCLRDQVSGYEPLKKHIEEFQDAQMNIVNDKVAKLDADFLEMALLLKEKFYPHLLTTISAISRAIEKGMQDGLSAGIVHGKEGKSLADVAAYNPSEEAGYNSALQRLREVDFPFLSELSSHKNASVEDIMNLLRLEGPLADAHRMSDLQPNVDQLMLLVHRSKDQVVLGETFMSFSLNVTHSRVERIKENVAARWLALIYVWAPLVDPLSAENLVGAAGTSDSVPATVATTTALSTTFTSTSSVPPIIIEDYQVVGTDGPEDAQNSQGNVVSFPTV
ncbi:hypothetical protein Tco_0869913, partial [Tanacetum coccineum]